MLGTTTFDTKVGADISLMYRCERHGIARVLLLRSPYDAQANAMASGTKSMSYIA